MNPDFLALQELTGDPTIYTTQTLIAGNPLLKEEEGKSLTGGFVWDIIDNMSISVDYYRIELTDAASQLSSSYLLANEANCRLGVDAQGNSFDLNSSFCQNIKTTASRRSRSTSRSSAPIRLVVATTSRCRTSSDSTRTT